MIYLTTSVALFESVLHIFENNYPTRCKSVPKLQSLINLFEGFPKPYGYTEHFSWNHLPRLRDIGPYYVKGTTV